MIDHKALKWGSFGNLPAKVPCKECPLARTSEPGALGGYSPMQYVDVILGVADLACHMSKGFDEKQPNLQRSCTGLAMIRANIGGYEGARNSMDAVEHVGPNRDLVFSTAIEFLVHHFIGCHEAKR